LTTDRSGHAGTTAAVTPSTSCTSAATERLNPRVPAITASTSTDESIPVR
jgi:hypothetical protein